MLHKELLWDFSFSVLGHGISSQGLTSLSIRESSGYKHLNMAAIINCDANCFVDCCGGFKLLCFTLRDQ